jgi:hypothetical protein
VSVNFYLSMWTISSPQLLGDVCSSKSLLVEIEKEKMHAHHTGTPAHTHMPCTAHTPCTHPCTGTHCTHAIHRHTRHAHIHAQAHTAHTPYTGTHAHARHCTRTRTALTHQCTARTHTEKKIKGKRGQSIQTIILRSRSCYLCQTHLFSSKGESNSTVELQIGRAAAPELVWWSRSPPKHTLAPHACHALLVFPHDARAESVAATGALGEAGCAGGVE